ncbi:gamma-aminobutyric acid receptor subunit alpha-2-like [Paramacrobiotus metropolitanus]|uniref:gamma-aminobutyric acid receptor subunit alpha-2-like n=1 Tax=Paramacrobiotus metropolitanus TaxID=2943436 RepID=UPI00244612CB|nr:gamma-aminobutyric acid receptor subunit alpha-2-like [Paramacrobiotus metropolitanus]XP_055332850.1 gamma-aminobutyric acid receptor subunit alpha-2-like [Paramacrobiotus metropolitanus]XP_055332852.1 gamma-aminobutyric acid receptor subunit alpha-2-like [Paramacrobiotus metropolitanus]XP_055332853.1 gamma-aminobutyric acid receptor subunit alpha-2-like [Paramacrobiotus metropolitanus]XP_055332854.1 gamma-aminobutyric acid receptor subunit alpha-2-like [Paramacrobiotus metropolitanus]XP_05
MQLGDRGTVLIHDKSSVRQSSRLPLSVVLKRKCISLCGYWGMLIMLLYGFGPVTATPRGPLRGRNHQTGQIFTEKEILDMLLENYDNKLRPRTTVNGTAGPVYVRVNLLVRSISKVDDLNMEYSTQLTFREEWNDDRLAYDDGGSHEYLVLPDPDRIWKPDLFFQNEKSAHLHNILVPNVFFRIYPNGDIMMSIRLSITLGCPMDLRFFPMDRQVCEIRMASYGYTTRDIDFAWKTSSDPEFYPVQVAPDLSMPRFRLAGRRVGLCSSNTATGSYSCLKVALFFQREFSYYLVQVYVPTCMLIFVSWVSFWLDPEATPARVSLGVTTLLTMATTQSGINSQLPPVSYTKAIDVWTGVCITFIFGALLEFAFVNYWSQVDKARQRKQQEANKKEEAARKELEAAATAGTAAHAAGNLGPKKPSQTSLDHYGQHRMHSMNRRSQRSPVYRTGSSGTRLDTENELLEVERNPSAYALRPLLPQRSKSRLNTSGDNHPSSFLIQTCAECNDMGISVDDGLPDYQNYDADLHNDMEETALDEGDGGGMVRMRSIGRNRSQRSNKSSLRCTMHDPHFTLLSNPSISAADLEAGNAHNVAAATAAAAAAHRHAMTNHIGGSGTMLPGAGSRRDLHASSDLDDHKRVAQPKQRSCFGGRIRVPSKRAKKIDFFSRLVFPLVFLIFNLLYWNLYLGNVREWPENI